jgi:hypothetical protein
VAQMKRIPGVKRYRAIDQGLSQIGRSAAVGDVALSAAQRLAGNANAVGDGEYEAGKANVTAGFLRETRSGARAFERLPHPSDAEERILQRVTDASAIKP